MSSSIQSAEELAQEVAALRERLARAEADRARAEAALQQSDDRFHAFLDNSPCVAFLKDARGRLIYGNAGLERFFSMSRAEFHGKGDYELFPAEIADRLREHDETVLATGRVLETVEIASGADGVRRSWLVMKFPVPDGASGRLVGGVAIDITERQRIEEQLRRSEELQRLIVEAVPGGVITVGADGSIRQANAEAQRIAGMSWEELSRRTIRDFESAKVIHEDGTPCPMEDYPVSRCMRTGEPQPAATFGIRKPDGTMSWAVYAAVPVFAPETGELTGAVATSLDVTARKQVEEELQQQKALLRSILDSMAEGVVVADQNGAFVLFNRAARQMAGVGSIAPQGSMNWSPAFGVWQADGVTPFPSEQLPLSRAIRGEAVDQVEMFVQNAEIPEGRWLSVSGRPVRDGEAHNLGVIVMRDVTERRRADEKLKEYAAELQSLSRRLLDVQEEERRHLACELHDEIGQVLTGLKLMLEATSRESPGERDQTLVDAKKLVQDLMGRVRGLSMNLRPTLLDDLGLLPALRWHIHHYTQRTGIQVNIERIGLESEGRMAAPVETAAYRIIQEALTNVARHARVREVFVRIEREPSGLHLRIEDHGPGFNPNRISESSGISGMRERAAILGGSLTVESSAQHGTRVSAFLPLS